MKIYYKAVDTYRKLFGGNTGTTSFLELPARERKKIIKTAARGAAEEQRALFDKYGISP